MTRNGAFMAMNSFRQFIAQYPSHTYKKGETILLRGDVLKPAYIIETGIVKTYTINCSGDERLVAFNRSEEDFPVGFAIGLVSQAPYFYEAFTICRIRFVPRAAYLQYLGSDMVVSQKQMTRLTILLIATFSRVDALEQTHAGDKIARTLMYMADQFGIFLRPYNNRLKLSVTQQEIANALGLTRETINVEIKKLEVKQLISHSRKNYVLYVERLRKYLDDNS